MIGRIEHQIQTWDGMGEVWRGLILPQIRTTLKARMEKERGKCVERTEGYSNDEDGFRRAFGIEPEADGSEAGGGLGEGGRGHGRPGPQ